MSGSLTQTSRPSRRGALGAFRLTVMRLQSFPIRAKRAPVLVVLHQLSSCPGLLAPLLAGMGAGVDVRRPRFGDPLPSTLEGHSGAIVMGGPMSANDGDEWVSREIEWLSVPLREGKPLMGICLGGQMLARHLGAKVFVRSDGRGQVGHHRLQLTDAGVAAIGTPPRGQVFHWHREGFSLPVGARLLAYDDLFTQAFSYGSALGLQFHPEADVPVMRRWMSEDPDAERMLDARPFASMTRGHEAVASAHRIWLRDLLTTWLASGAQPQKRLAIGEDVADRTHGVERDHPGEVTLASPV